jgi:two-component system OmpR family sensor kinase
MTRRLVAAIVGAVVATLLLAGAGTLVLANLRARHTTERELRSEAASVAANIDTILDVDASATPVQLRRRLRVAKAFAGALPIDELAVLTTDAAGNLSDVDLPSGLTLDVLRPAALARLQVVSGNSGNLVFAAAPALISGSRLVVVVITRQANAGLGASVRYFVLTAAATVVLGLLAAVALGRRLTRPIRDASAATQRIAAGELSTRLQEPAANDHDELAELSRSINGMAEGLQRSRVLEQQFLLSVSHDLRTPLTSIRGYAEAIADGAAEPRAAADVIRSESRRLERLVADLLDLAKLQSRSFSLQPVALDVGAALVTAVSGFGPDAADRSVELRTLSGPPVVVLADPDRVAQIAANLIENALKFARFTVTVSARVDGAFGVVTVDDDGPGIEPSDIALVFERLYVARSQPTRSESTSGLGLAIVRELVEAMHGSVGAGVADHGGARLWFRLPLAPR